MKVLVVPLCSDGKTPEEVNRCVQSVIDQEDHPFDWEMKVVCNTNSDQYYHSIRAAIPEEFEVVQTESNGGNGMGHNSVLDLFRNIYKQNDYTHLMMIDADDYYYPCAFECIDDIARFIPFDYLSNMQTTDSVRTFVNRTGGQPIAEVQGGIFLHSNFNLRHPIPPYVYWDGEHCGGGEVTLCVSSKAVECGLRHMEIPMIPDDFTHMLHALKAHVEQKILFVNTDCNDVYVYDKTNASSTTNQPEFIFDPNQWPAPERELLVGQTFECLRGVTRQQLPWVTIPQIMGMEEKIEFIRGMLLL